MPYVDENKILVVYLKKTHPSIAFGKVPNQKVETMRVYFPSEDVK